MQLGSAAMPSVPLGGDLIMTAQPHRVPTLLHRSDRLAPHRKEGQSKEDKGRDRDKDRDKGRDKGRYRDKVRHRDRDKRGEWPSVTVTVC